MEESEESEESEEPVEPDEEEEREEEDEDCHTGEVRLGWRWARLFWSSDSY